jgi:hypothetical protein
MPATTASDFEQWVVAQIADTGPFTLLIVLLRIRESDVVAVKSSYAHVVGDELGWDDMRRLLDSARTSWDGVAFFVGLDTAGGPLADAAAARALREVEADVAADPLALNRGRFFDRSGRHLRIDEVAR